VQISGTFTIDAPVEAVMAAIRNPEMIEESEKSRDALNVEIRDLIQTDAEHDFEIHVDAYAIGLTGVDKSTVEHNLTIVQWNLATRVGTWVWKGGGKHAKRVTISGAYRLTEKGGKTDMDLTVDIEIPIPVVGKRIAGKVASEFEKQWLPYAARVERWAKKA